MNIQRKKLRGEKQRLDIYTAEALSVSREKAQAMILAGQITAGDQPARKPGQLVEVGTRVTGPAKTAVSRAGPKLGDALDAWQLKVTGQTVLDAGSSTGGFTEALLERGARKVYAVDVGTGQLDWNLRQDKRVVSMEQTDIRKLETLPEIPTLAVIDVSFISLKQVLPAIAKLLPPDAPVIALFKPQFEVGRVAASKSKGVITDEPLITKTLDVFKHWLTEHDWKLVAARESTVAGNKGNRERLLHLVTPGTTSVD